ncbi:MAG TPA: hypothetical protein VGV34_06715, partial [Solirubrobacterales bacterium]|nr:hypothetical protein [Solirubrobacterales bacterium]
IADGLQVDQRGLTRPYDFASIPNAPGGDGTDVGAFEVQPPPSPQPPPLPGAPPPPPDGRVWVRIQGGKLMLNQRRQVHVRITCPVTEQSPPCRGALILRTRKRVELGGGKRLVVMAKRKFSIGAGKTARLTVRLNPRKASLLQTEPATRSLLAIARVRDGAGNRATVRKRLHIALPTK